MASRKELHMSASTSASVDDDQDDYVDESADDDARSEDEASIYRESWEDDDEEDTDGGSKTGSEDGSEDDESNADRTEASRKNTQAVRVGSKRTSQACDSPTLQEVDTGPPLRKRRKTALETAQNQIELLTDKNKKLSTELALLKGSVVPQVNALFETMLKLGMLSTAPSRVLQSSHFQRSRERGENVKLLQLFNIGDSSKTTLADLNAIKGPVRFGNSSAFPHAIESTQRTERELQVEARRKICIDFVLKEDDVYATEKRVRPDGNLPFTLSILYSLNNDEVHSSDFAGCGINELTKPKFDNFRTQRMVNGRVSFEFYLCFTSCDTTPRQQQFRFKVTPADEELKDDPHLTVLTPVFRVRSKVTVQKKKDA